MPTYVALLRAVNVGGRTIPMTELRDCFIDLGFTDVSTYIQSGNVIFGSRVRSTTKVAEVIEKRFGPAAVRTPAELETIVAGNPFAKRSFEPRKLHVSFLSTRPTRVTFDAPPGDDEFVIAGREVYVYTPNGYGTTKLNNMFFERKLGVTATSRNWNTVVKLSVLAASGA